MKFIALAVLAFVSTTSAIRYDESEGPTKVDLSENDDEVLARADDDGTKKWQKENPLSWADEGDADETVLTMLDGTLRRI